MKNFTRSLLLTMLVGLCLSLSFSLSTSAQVVTGKASSQFCNDLQKNTSGVVKCSSETQGVSFTQFKGQLEAPSTEGYDPSLTRAKTLREFILQVVQFALGFLGLIAVVVIIYGGFLYVTSAGNEDQANKGKNAIMYSVIGIIIILLSFALVNSLLLATTGSDNPQAGNGSLQGNLEGETSERELFYKESAQKIQKIGGEVIEEYQKYIDAVI